DFLCKTALMHAATSQSRISLRSFSIPWTWLWIPVPGPHVISPAQSVARLHVDASPTLCPSREEVRCQPSLRLQHTAVCRTFSDLLRLELPGYQWPQGSRLQSVHRYDDWWNTLRKPFCERKMLVRRARVFPSSRAARDRFASLVPRVSRHGQALVLW